MINLDSMAIWSRFTKTGKVEDYLMYKKSLKNKNNTYIDGEPDYEDEYGRSDTQGTEYW
ncbi:MAG: hypothetical protein IJA80_05675 [Clostridia bacterium]|nr:hypothetical protein [Clostridia bacterium]